MDTLQIRTAAVSDTPIIAHIINEAWKIAYAGIVPQPALDSLSDERKASQLRTGLEHYPLMQYFLFETNGIPLGATCLHPAREDDLPGAAEFSFFYFLPQAWRHGYGTILLRYLLEAATKQGYRQICCWVLEDNGQAIAFYESQGLLRDGTHQMVMIGKDLTAVRCVMNLPSNE